MYVSSASNQDLSESFSQLCNYFRKTKQPKTKQNKKSTKPKETFYHGIRHYIYLLQYVVCLKILNIFSLWEKLLSKNKVLSFQDVLFQGWFFIHKYDPHIGSQWINKFTQVVL